MTAPADPTAYYCPHCPQPHTIPPRTSEPLRETVKRNHAERVARMKEHKQETSQC